MCFRHLVLFYLFTSIILHEHGFGETILFNEELNL